MNLISNKKFLILEKFISCFTIPWKLWFKQFLNCIIISNKTNMKNAYKNIPFAWLSWCRPLNAWITDVKISCDRCFNGGYKNQLRDTNNILFAEIWIYKKKIHEHTIASNHNHHNDLVPFKKCTFLVLLFKRFECLKRTKRLLVVN